MSHKLEVNFLVMLDNHECGIGQPSSYDGGDKPYPLPEAYRIGYKIKQFWLVGPGLTALDKNWNSCSYGKIHLLTSKQW